MSRAENETSMTDVSNGGLPLSAPSFLVYDRAVVSVEHPFVIQNLEKGIASLGSQRELMLLVNDASQAFGRVYYRPGDRTTKPLRSTNVETNDLLLKITVPKTIRVRRKRNSTNGVDGSNIDQSSLIREKDEKDVVRLLRSLRDKPTSCQVQISGIVQQTHRFRGMPDFATSTANAPFMQQMKENILPFEYEKLKLFQFDKTKGVKPDTEIVPPPLWSQAELPFNYSYHQNPSVRHVIDEEGNVDTYNIHSSRIIDTQPVPYDVPVVPNRPSARLMPIEKLEPLMQKMVREVQRLFEHRPIFTQRALQNSLPAGLWSSIGPNSAKHAFQYAAYTFTSGPWRNSFVKFGVDPRTDSKYRVYQTMMILAEGENQDDLGSEAARSRTLESVVDSATHAEKSHLFDGSVVSKECKVWQVCDISDPTIAPLLATQNLRPNCHVESDGWYWNGTWAKAKGLVKAIRNQLVVGKNPPDRALYDRIAREVPDILRRGDVISKQPKGPAASSSASSSTAVSAEETRILQTIRSIALNYRPALVPPLSSLAASEERSPQQRPIDDDQEEEAEEREEDVVMAEDEGDDDNHRQRIMIDPALQISGAMGVEEE